MEHVAEGGFTAHWVYKENGKNDSTTAQIRAQRWLQSLVEIQQSVGNSFEFIENVKSEFFPKEIYVFTPKGGFRLCRSFRCGEYLCWRNR